MANNITFHPWLAEQAQVFCRELHGAVSANAFAFSIHVSRAPFGVADFASRLTESVLPVCLDDMEALIGPLYLAGCGICSGCLDHWLDINLYDRGYPQEVPSLDIARGLVEKLSQWSNELIQTGSIPGFDGGALSLDYRTWDSMWHPVFPLKGCERCNAVRKPDLQISPQIHCSRWTGIVNRMEMTIAPSVGAFRASSTWSAPVPVANARPFLKRQKAFGRGRTQQQAEFSCIGEALERYSLIYRGDEPMVRARLGDIDAIHPDDIQLFSNAQYAERDVWNAQADDIFFVSERFDSEQPVDWLEAKALGSTVPDRFVAAGCCLMWYQFRTGEPEFARADTVGCGTGVTFDDALTHALLEWIERDAMAIWWDNRLNRPGIRIESFGSKDLQDVAIGLHAIGRQLFLLDCTNDIGIPAYVSVAPRFDGTEPIFAGAAHWSPSKAAYRAASEVGQMWYAAKTTGEATPKLYDWLLNESIASQPYLFPSCFNEAPEEIEVTTAERINYIVEHLENANLRAYAVDHSRPDVLWPTARAVVPGLRHIWNRRAPGRLYDVPVKMGWLPEPLCESRLNPVRCMI